jgi:hypothetical protein
MNVEDKACTKGGIQKSKHFFPTGFHGLVIYKCNYWSLYPNQIIHKYFPEREARSEPRDDKGNKNKMQMYFSDYFKAEYS